MLKQRRARFKRAYRHRRSALLPMRPQVVGACTRGVRSIEMHRLVRARAIG
jgi:hypothetical protein